MNPKNIRLKVLLPNLFIAFAYPVIAYFIADSNPLYYMINAMTITGLIFIVLGVLYSFVLHGDLDITSYVAMRALNKGKKKTYADYKQDKNDDRKNSFNYPLLNGILLLIAAAVATAFY